MRVCKFTPVRNNKDHLQNAIFKVLSDEELRERFGEEGRRRVREQFNWDMSVGKIEGVYEDRVKGGIR